MIKCEYFFKLAFLYVLFFSLKITCSSTYFEMLGAVHFMVDKSLELNGKYLYNSITKERCNNLAIEERCVSAVRTWYKFMAGQLSQALDEQNLQKSEKIRESISFGPIKFDISDTFDNKQKCPDLIYQQFYSLIRANNNKINCEYAAILLQGYDNLAPSSEDIRVIIEALNNKGLEVLQNGKIYDKKNPMIFF